MDIRTRILTAVCATILVGASLPAGAAELNVLGVGVNTGNTTGGGSTVAVGTNGSTLGVTLGGGSNVASVNTNATGTPTVVGIGNTNGPLIASTTNPDGSTSANVNLGGVGAGGLGGLGGLGDLGDLGGLLGGVDLGGLLPGDGGNGGSGNGGDGAGVVQQINVAFGGLGGGEQQQLRMRCQSILSSPGAFEPNLVALCRIIARINITR